MAHMIEEAKTGRASCKICREKIEKGQLRFGEEVPNMFSADAASYAWHHMACAAKKKPHELREALAAYAGDVPDRAELEAAIEEAAKKVRPKPAGFPYAERAPTGRSKCLVCEAMIEKGELRVAIEREVDAGGMVNKSAGYLHPKCAPEGVEDAELLEKVKRNSRGLAAEDLAALAEALG